MPANVKGKSLLTLEEFTPREILELVDMAIDLKGMKRLRVFPRSLSNRNFALVFLKPSTRTRTSFVVAASDEGAHLEIFGSQDIRFGEKESVKDIARVLGRMFDGIAFRGYHHAVVAEIAEHAGVPVWNCLSDDHHPTQVLADLMTIKEEFGRIAGVPIAFVGDGRNNMVNSLMIAAARMGLDLRIVAPSDLQPSPEMVARCRAQIANPFAKITITDHVAEGVRDCLAVYGDVWVSMGEESQIERRIALLSDYRIDQAMMDATGRPEAIFLHCLPALHDLNTEFVKSYPGAMDCTDDVFEGEKSRVLEQAENRMHTIKALMVATV